MSHLPRRIACLSTETVEVLYLLGEEARIVGISGYTVRPPRARKEKPKISAFSSGSLEKVLAVQPDLVLGFSDLQADLCRDLMKAGVEVHLFNQRDIAGILRMVDCVGRLVGATERSTALVTQLEQRLAEARIRGEALVQRLGRRPRVYFEEWDSPMISGIRWVSELIELAGGEDIFADLSQAHDASGRIIADATEVVRRAPDLIIASWCGKHFRAETLTHRPGWSQLAALAEGRVAEIKSALILSPGVAALTEALDALEELMARTADQLLRRTPSST